MRKQEHNDTKKKQGRAFLLPTSKELAAMRDVDIRTVDRSALVEISEIEIDTSLPEQERMLRFVEQVKNPYCYLDHGTVVKISFGGGGRLEDCLKNCVR